MSIPEQGGGQEPSFREIQARAEWELRQQQLRAQAELAAQRLKAEWELEAQRLNALRELKEPARLAEQERLTQQAKTAWEQGVAKVERLQRETAARDNKPTEGGSSQE